MDHDRDSGDDGLSWDGDIRDPTHVDGDRPRDTSASATAAREVRTTDAGADTDADGQAPSGGSVALVVYSALAGAYLLFTIGWALAASRSGISLPNPFFDVMYQIGAWLAVAAPAAWFALTFLLTRGTHRRRSTAIRLISLAVGLVFVAPWPFIVGGA